MLKLIRMFLMLAILSAAGIYFGGQALLDRALEPVVGTRVRIGGMSLGFSPAELELRDVKVLNLKNFKEPVLAFLPVIYVRVRPLDFLRGRTHIQSLRIHIQKINVEHNAAGQVNLNELRKILALRQAAKKSTPSSFSQQASPRPASSPSRRQPAQNLVIDRGEFSLEKVIYLDTAKKPVYKKEYVLNIRDEVLHDLTDPVYVTEQIIMSVLRHIGLGLMSMQWDQAAAQAGQQASVWMEQARESLSGMFRGK